MTQPLGTINVREAARQLGVARQRLYQLVEMGILPAIRKNGRVWIPQSAVDARRAGTDRLRSVQCVSPREVGEFFGVGERTVREWHRLGLLPAQRINNRLCFAPADVITFVPPASAGRGRPPGRRGTRTLRGRHFPLPPNLKGNHGKEHEQPHG